MIPVFQEGVNTLLLTVLFSTIEMITKLDPQVVYEFIVITFLTIWLLLTVLCQFKETKISSYVRGKVDVFGLIPLWTFFAPRPGKRDYHLLYRDKINDEINSEWQELEITEERSFWSWFWNPEKRDKKILSDIVQNLVSSIPHYKNDKVDHDLLMFSMPYIIVLHAVSQCKVTEKDTLRQFMLAETSGYFKDIPPSVILLSVFHQI